ncbi:cytoskeleton protein RodZ [Parasalinivibrio latis]|uniref:cytoskeleton protein RodZ n=1 Tax=Parasalinivibrio latis TaxID=2952610 RepID=UPI0030E1FC9F
MTTELHSEPHIDAPLQSAGSLLKEKREALGLSVKDVAERLHLRTTVVEAIEQDHTEFDQISTYVRGYVRAYAKLVDLNADELIALMPHLKTAEVHHASQMQSFSRKTNHEKRDNRLMTLTWLIIAIIVGVSGYWWWQNSRVAELSVIEQPVSGTTETAEQPVRETSPDSVEPAPVEEPASPASGSPAVESNPENTPEVVEPQVEADNSAEQAVTEPPVVPEPQTVETVQQSTEAVANPVVPEVSETPTAGVPPAAPVQQSPTSDLLVVKFSSDCWVDIRDASGKRLAIGIKGTGDTLNLSGKPPYKVVLGAPEVVTMTYDGESVDLGKYESGNVARFTLP